MYTLSIISIYTSNSVHFFASSCTEDPTATAPCTRMQCRTRGCGSATTRISWRCRQAWWGTLWGWYGVLSVWRVPMLCAWRVPVRTYMFMCIHKHALAHTCTHIYICICDIWCTFKNRYGYILRYIDLNIILLNVHVWYSINICIQLMWPLKCIRGVACLPGCVAGWRALCRLLRRTTGCRCIMQLQTTLDQRWWQRCCKRTLTLQASLMWYVVVMIWGILCV